VTEPKTQPSFSPKIRHTCNRKPHSITADCKL